MKKLILALVLSIATVQAEVNKKEEDNTVIPNAKLEERKDSFNLMAHNPLYFIYNPQNTKVQASFKYKIHRNINIYVAYTQLMLWDLSETSKPVLDVNYNPEMFYRWEIKDHTRFESIDLVPYGHISNGKGGDDTRSLNYTAAQLNLKTDVRKNIIFRSSLRLKYMYDFDLIHKDIRKYHGPAELRMAITGFTSGFLDKGEIAARLYSGGTFGEDLTKGGQEIGISFRVLGIEITPAFYLQYFHGYSETLRYYNKEEHIIRFGLLL